MRISDWSSDGCSSDLRNGTGTRQFSATLARHGILSPREVCSQNLSTYPKAIKIVGPMLHHFDALVPVTPSSICASNVIAFNMRKLALDGVRVPFSHFIEKRAGRCPKPMGGNFRLVITQSAQCGVQGVVGDRPCHRADAGEKVLPLARHRLQLGD